MDEDSTKHSSRSGRAITAWAPVIAWATVIFAFSAQPDLRIASDPSLDFALRKLGHVAVFAVLGLLVWRAVATTSTWHRPWALALVLTVAYAMTDEWHQGFVSGRNPSPVDVAIDGAGALLAIVAVHLVLARRGRTSPR
jgi:VanZ family protein